MSNTKVDLPKVCQALDNGWTITLFRNGLGSYTAVGEHENLDIWSRCRDKWLAGLIDAGWTKEAAESLVDTDFDTEGRIETDDFTPEQAATRLAYKIHGECI